MYSFKVLNTIMIRSRIVLITVTIFFIFQSDHHPLSFYASFPSSLFIEKPFGFHFRSSCPPQKKPSIEAHTKLHCMLSTFQKHWFCFAKNCLNDKHGMKKKKHSKTPCWNSATHLACTTVLEWRVYHWHTTLPPLDLLLSLSAAPLSEWRALRLARPN